MIMVRSIVRPEKAQDVIDGLFEAGYSAITRMSVAGRGRQRGIKVGEVMYDELPKELLLMVIPGDEKDVVLKTIMTHARTSPAGAYGDGKIFVSDVDEVYTISSGFKEE
ncbi:MAG: P-II family nitrogen regulator [Spirochaetota bacterium]